MAGDAYLSRSVLHQNSGLSHLTRHGKRTPGEYPWCVWVSKLKDGQSGWQGVDLRKGRKEQRREIDDSLKEHLDYLHSSSVTSSLAIMIPYSLYELRRVQMCNSWLFQTSATIVPGELSTRSIHFYTVLSPSPKLRFPLYSPLYPIDIHSSQHRTAHTDYQRRNHSICPPTAESFDYRRDERCTHRA